MRIKWSEKAIRLVNEYGWSKREIEEDLRKKRKQKTEMTVGFLIEWTKQVVFTLDDDDLIDAEVRLR